MALPHLGANLPPTTNTPAVACCVSRGFRGTLGVARGRRRASPERTRGGLFFTTTNHPPAVSFSRVLGGLFEGEVAERLKAAVC